MLNYVYIPTSSRVWHKKYMPLWGKYWLTSCCSHMLWMDEDGCMCEWALMCLAWQKGSFTSFNKYVAWMSTMCLAWQKGNFTVLISVWHEWAPGAWSGRKIILSVLPRYARMNECLGTWPGKKVILWMNVSCSSDVIDKCICEQQALHCIELALSFVSSDRGFLFLPIMRQWATSMATSHFQWKQIFKIWMCN